MNEYTQEKVGNTDLNWAAGRRLAIGSGWCKHPRKDQTRYYISCAYISKKTQKN